MTFFLIMTFFLVIQEEAAAGNERGQVQENSGGKTGQISGRVCGAIGAHLPNQGISGLKVTGMLIAGSGDK